MRPEDEVEEQEVDRLLAHLDDPPPRVRAQEVVARARRSKRAWMRWAAGFALAIVLAGGAYAAPGSPLPRWVAQLRQLERRTGAPEQPGPLGTEPVAPDPVGVAFDPGPSLTITFAAPQQTGRLTVVLSDDPEVVIRASGGAPAFDSGLDRLAIDNRGSSADFVVQIPRSATHVEVRVGERRLLVSEMGRVTTGAPASAEGGYELQWTERAP
jgi:hypothetical protein